MKVSNNWFILTCHRLEFFTCHVSLDELLADGAGHGAVLGMGSNLNREWEENTENRTWLILNLLNFFGHHYQEN